MKIDQIGGYPFAYIYASITGTAQTINNDSMTSIFYNAEVEKINITHSTVSDKGQFTLTQAGIYIIDASIAIAQSTGGNVRTLQVTLNGTQYDIDDVCPLSPGIDGTQRLSIHASGRFAVNDVLRIQVYQDSGGDLDITVGAVNTNVKIMRIR